MATTETRATGGIVLPQELTKHDVELWSRAGLGSDYLLVGRARAGSFGTVFRARVAPRDLEVAVKVVSPARAGGAEAVQHAFEKAAQLARALGDDSVLVPLAIGRGQEVAYQIAPWMPGGSVADILRSGAATPTESIVSILRAAATVLDRAHARGVTHLGVRPGNLLFDAQGRLRIADFGADPLLDAAGAQRAGSSVTVQSYDAPEKRRGKQADGRADQFSLAVIAYELLSGERRVDMRGVEGIPTVGPLEIDAFTPVRRGLGLHVNAALRTALGAGAANRFPTVGAFVDALEGRIATVSGEETVRYRFASFRPRTTTMVLVVLGGVAIAAAYLDPDAHRVARRGWRMASGIFGKPVAQPPVPAVRVTVRSSDGRVLPSAPDPSSGARASRATATSSTPSSPADRAASASQRRTSPDLPPELEGGAESRATVTTTVAAGRRLASSTLDRAVSPKPSTPVRATSSETPTGVGSFVRRLFAGVGGGVSTSTEKGGAASEAAEASSAATFITVEAGGTALVTVDGIPRGAAPTTVRVSPGRHSVAVHAPGVTYAQPTTTVVVSRGTTTAVTFSPSPQRP